ncbi:MAG: DUF1080 domain-containing protein [Planctomycetes bacterium]|nr:DUF1080 domain-containing protein [Planctomycetota bacterium]
MTLIYLGAGAAALVGILILWSLGSGPKPTQTAKVEAKKPDPPPTFPVYAPMPPPPSANPSGAPAQNAPLIPEPAGAKTRELTPKELFEQRQREAKSSASTAEANTPERAKTEEPKAVDPKPAGSLLALPSPPADDASWKPLFNGQDLKGWTSAKGKWVVDGDALKSDPSSGGASRIDAKAPFCDFEFTCQLYSDDTEYTHIQFRETFGIPIYWHPKGKWIAFRAVAVGGVVEASLDGTPVQAKGGAGADPRSANIRIFVSEGWTVKIKDIRIRELKP